MKKTFIPNPRKMRKKTLCGKLVIITSLQFYHHNMVEIKTLKNT